MLLQAWYIARYDIVPSHPIEPAALAPRSDSRFITRFRFFNTALKTIHAKLPVYLQELIMLIFLKKPGAYRLRSSSNGLLLETPSRQTTILDKIKWNDNPQSPQTMMKARRSKSAPFWHHWNAWGEGWSRFPIYFVQDCSTSDRSFQAAGLKLRNALPHEIRSISEINAIKHHLKPHLFSNAFLKNYIIFLF